MLFLKYFAENVSSDDFNKISPKSFAATERCALLPLTLYMLVATVAFPQAYKDAGDRPDHVDYNFFRLVALPVLYHIGPIVTLYALFKKKD